MSDNFEEFDDVIYNAMADFADLLKDWAFQKRNQRDFADGQATTAQLVGDNVSTAIQEMVRGEANDQRKSALFSASVVASAIGRAERAERRAMAKQLEPEKFTPYVKGMEAFRTLCRHFGINAEKLIADAREPSE